MIIDFIKIKIGNIRDILMVYHESPDWLVCVGKKGKHKTILTKFISVLHFEQDFDFKMSYKIVSEKEKNVIGQ